MSRVAGARVWLKVDSLQPSGSFKIRGIGASCEEARAKGATAFVSSSGGNAGLAVAWAGRELGVPVTVYVPRTTSERMIGKMRDEGARVEVHGEAWDDAHAAALKATEGTGAFYVHPFDAPAVWRGNATMVTEAVGQGMKRPDAVVVSVGGGGLLCGVLEGMHTVGWKDVPVLAVETVGAASLAAAMEAGEPVDIGRIASIATTLGARRVCDRVSRGRASIASPRGSRPTGKRGGRVSALRGRPPGHRGARVRRGAGSGLHACRGAGVSEVYLRDRVRRRWRDVRGLDALGRERRRLNKKIRRSEGLLLASHKQTF